MPEIVRTSLGSSLLAGLLLTGCFGNEVTEFPDGLEPLEVNDLAPPMGTLEDPYPEDFNLEATDGGRYDILLGRGYIQAPIVDVWAAYREPGVGSDRRTVDEWSSTPLEDPNYDYSYVIHQTAHELVTVEWDVTWRHGLVEGTAEAPELVAIRFQKTSGSTLVRVIDGSILLRPVGDGSVTEVELAYHANATGASRDSYLGYMRDIYDSAVEVSHGRPLPEWE